MSITIKSTKGLAYPGNVTPSALDIREFPFPEEDTEEGRVKRSIGLTPFATKEGYALIPEMDKAGAKIEDLQKAYDEGQHFGVYADEDKAKRAAFSLASQQRSWYHAMQLKGLANATRDFTPEHVAKADAIGQKLRIDPVVVNRDLKQFNDHMAAVDFNPYELLEKHKSTAMWALEHPHNLVAARQDLGVLGRIERLWNLFRTGVSQGWENTQGAKLYYDQLIYGVDNEEAIKAFEKNAESFVGAPQDELGHIAHAVGGFLGGSVAPVVLNTLRRGSEMGLLAGAAGAALGAPTGPGSAVTGAVGAATGFAMGAKAGAAEAMLLLESAESMREMSLMQGDYGTPIEKDIIIASSLAAGTINAMLEYTAASKILGVMPGLRNLTRSQIREALRSDLMREAIIKNVGRTGGAFSWEVMTEGIQRAVTLGSQEIGKKFSDVTLPERTLGEIADESLDEMKEAAYAIGPVIGGGSAITTTMDAYRTRGNRGKDAAAILELTKAVKESKMREENPIRFESFMQRTTPANKATTLIEAEQVAEYFGDNPEGLKEFLSTLGLGEADLQKALEVGGFIEADTAKVATHILGKDQYQGLEKNMKFSENALTANEMQTFVDFNFFLDEYQRMSKDAESDLRVIELREQLLEQTNYKPEEVDQMMPVLAAFSARMHEANPELYPNKMSFLESRIDNITSGKAPEGFALPQSAYHGTHTKGIREFLLKYVGTGEGAQGYGWGLYFTKTFAIAEHYRTALSPLSGLLFRGVPFQNLRSFESVSRDAVDILEEAFKKAAVSTDIQETIENVIEDLSDQLIRYQSIVFPDEDISDTKAAIEEALDFLKENRDDFSPANATLLDGQLLTENSDVDGLSQEELRKAISILNWHTSVTSAIADLKGIIRQLETIRKEKAEDGLIISKVDRDLELYKKILNFVQGNTDRLTRQVPGQTYMVDIPDYESMGYLDWDLRIDEQPDKVQEKIKDLVQNELDFLEPEALPSKSGKTLYKLLVIAKKKENQVSENEAKKLASLTLAKYGFVGIRYADGSTRRRRGQKKYNYVIFDESTISVIKEFYQSAYKAQVIFNEATHKATMVFYESHDLSSFFHEVGHIMKEALDELASLEGSAQWIKDDQKVIDKWLSRYDNKKALETFYNSGLRQNDEFKGRELDSLTSNELEQVRRVAKHEMFARGFERYLREGKAPSNSLKEAFRHIKKWLTDIYKTVRLLNVELNDDVRSVFDRLLAAEIETEKLKNTARGKSVLDSEALTKDMTPEELQKLQDKKREADEHAKENLTAATLIRWRKLKATWREQAKTIVENDPFYDFLDRLIRGEFWGRTPVERAEELEAKKLPAADILFATGWFRNKNGKWRRKQHGRGLNREAFLDEYGPEIVARLERHGDIFKKNGYTPDEMIREVNILFPNTYILDDFVEALSKRLTKSEFIADYVSKHEMEHINSIMATGEYAFSESSSELIELEIKAILKVLKKKEAASEEAIAEITASLETLQEELKKLEAAATQDSNAIKLLKAKIEKLNKTLAKAKEAKTETAVQKRTALLPLTQWMKDRNIKYLREYAKKLVSQMVVKDVPKSISKTIALARKHADKAVRASIRENWAEVLEARKYQLLAEITVTEMVKFRKEADRTIHLVRKWQKSKAINFAHREWIERLVRRFGLTGAFNPKEQSAEHVHTPLTDLISFTDENSPVQYEAAFGAWLVDNNTPLFWKELTVEEFTEVTSLLRTLKTLGSRASKVFIDGKYIESHTIADIASRPMLDLPARTQASGDTRIGSLIQFFSKKFERYRADQDHLLEFVTRAMDGYNDDGPNAEYFRRRIKRARNDKLVLSRKITDQLNVALKDLFHGRLERHKKLGKKFDIPGVPLPEAIRIVDNRTKWTNDELIAAVLNTGNAGNLRALQEGWGIPDQQVAALRNFLTEKEMRAVQAIWDILDDLYDAINKVHVEAFGTPVKRVEPQSFTTKYGEFRGGFYPLAVAHAYINEADSLAKERDLKLHRLNAYQAPSVNLEFTKSRTGTRLPPLLDTSILLRHIDDVSHMITHLIPIRDIDRYTRVKEWRDAFTRVFGREAYLQIREFLIDIGRPDQGLQEQGDRFWKWAVNRGTLNGLAFRLTSMARQLPAIWPATKEVGTEDMLKAMWFALKHPLKARDMVYEMSEYMRERAGYRDYDKQSARGLSRQGVEVEINGRIISWKDVEKFGFYGLRAFEMAVSIPSWLGQYNKSRRKYDALGWDEEKSHERAKLDADEVIESTQGSMDIYGLSRVQRRWSFMRLFTMFSSWSMQYGSRSKYHWNAWRNGKMSTEEFARYVWYEQLLQPLMEFYIIALPSMLVFGVDDDDDKESHAAELLRSVASFYLGGRIFSRQLGSLVGYGKGLFGSPAFAGPEALTRLILHGWKAGDELLEDGEIDPERAEWLAWAAFDTASYVIGVPVSRMVKNQLRTWERLSEDN
jgi:hypothetical protein